MQFICLIILSNSTLPVALSPLIPPKDVDLTETLYPIFLNGWVPSFLTNAPKSGVNSAVVGDYF